MTGRAEVHILLVEDDSDDLNLLMRTLPGSLLGFSIIWHECSDFGEAVGLVKSRHYDMVATDVYLDRRGSKGRKKMPEDARAPNIVAEIRDKRFCPIVVFSSAVIPESIAAEPFVKLADKAKVEDIAAAVKELLATGVLQAVWRIHDDIERGAGSYLWRLLNTQWDTLCRSAAADPVVLERVIRRRASIQIGRLDPDAEDVAETATVEGAEFYIYPPISAEHRLGDVLRDRKTGAIRVVLTPHCHLAVQEGGTRPRADYVLTVKAFEAEETISKAYTGGDGTPRDAWKGDREDKLRRRIQSPAQMLGKPDGRYWFLPAFLDLPDSYCDFLQLESLPLDSLDQSFEWPATLDTPFAEALQSCFSRFYMAVGLPKLRPARFAHLVSAPPKTSSTPQDAT